MGITAAIGIGALVGGGVTAVEGKKAARHAEVKSKDAAAAQDRENQKLLAEAEQAEQDKEAAESGAVARDVKKRKQNLARASKQGRQGTILTGGGAGTLGGGATGGQGPKTLLGV